MANKTAKNGIDKNTKRGNAKGGSGESPDSYTGVDIRVFLLSITVAMSTAFLAGVSFAPESLVTPTDVGSSSLKNAATTSGGNKGGGVSSAPPGSTINGTPLNLLSEEEERKLMGEHHPSGQHLLVDIEFVESEFLNSEERLAHAMTTTVEEAGLTMLSYHCHKLEPAGVSCVGVLLESHISFHTWPEEGVITLDLFTCGSNPLLPVVPVIERLFGVGEKALSKWSHELRGFRPEGEKKKNYLSDFSDLSIWVLSPLEIYSKKQIYSNLTEFQRVDIWDLVEVEETPGIDEVEKYDLKEGDPRWDTPELVTPDRILFLDGTVQSVQSTEKEYHEALVHPGMFAHPNPKNVAVVGGGEGATIREILKHNTIESITMIEIDEELIQIARQYLPQMSDCSDLTGRAANCFDDELVNLVHADAGKWFMDNFGEGSNTEAKFDVVIFDALDPEDEADISQGLYGNKKLVTAILNSLTDDGVIVVQTGTAPDITDPKASEGVYSVREHFFNMLENHDDVDVMLVYEEPRCGFFEPHSFLVVCKDETCRSRWYARSDEIDYGIYERIVHTNSKKPALYFYDGTTQYSYQITPKAWETVYCRREPMPFECAYRHLDTEKEIHDLFLEEEDKEYSTISVKTVEKDEGVKQHVIYADVDIPKGSYIMPDHLARSLVVTTRNLEGLRENLKVPGGGRVSVIEDLLEFIDENGHESHSGGSMKHFIEIGGTVMMRSVETEEEANVGRWVPPHPSGRRPVYSPVYERHRVSFDVFMVATKDIPAGGELLKYKYMWDDEKLA